MGPECIEVEGKRRGAVRKPTPIRWDCYKMTPCACFFTGEVSFFSKKTDSHKMGHKRGVGRPS